MSSPSRFVPVVQDDPDAEFDLEPTEARSKRNKERKKPARPESLDHAIEIAWCDWAAGMIIGLMPLLCHLLLHFAAKSAPDWDDNWSPDLLFITISNSGLVAVTVFTRMLGAHLSISSLTPVMRIVWGMTIVCFALASMLYGAAATGMSNRLTGWTAMLFVVFSAYCSLTFELAVAREHFVPKRVRKHVGEGQE